jgi:hypothetical protein
MFEIKTQILIDSPVESVWNCLTDTQNYSRWNQFIRKIEGQFSANQTLKITIAPPDNKSMDFKPTCIALKPNQELRWVGKMGFEWLFRGEHYFLLEKVNNQQTKLIHGEKFTGIIVPLFKKLRGNITQKGFELMNQNLVDHVLKK